MNMHLEDSIPFYSPFSFYELEDLIFLIYLFFLVTVTEYWFLLWRKE